MELISTSCLENRQETALNLAADWLFYRTCRSANCSRTPATDFQEVDDDENCSTGPETVVFIYREPSVEAVLGDFLKQQLTPKSQVIPHNSSVTFMGQFGSQPCVILQ